MLLRVLLIAEHASERFGGEALLPLQYFRLLRRRGCEVWMIVHERTRAELDELLGEDAGRVYFVRDTALHRLLWRVGRPLPWALRFGTTGHLLRLLTQWKARRIARDLVRELGIDVVHQPIPVSPRDPSLLHGLGAPVVIGPLNGGMVYPPAFQHMEGPMGTRLLEWEHRAADWMNALVPGKRRAAILMVANERTRDALPRGVRAPVIVMSENGVDLTRWPPKADSSSEADGTRCLFVGRLVPVKGVDLLLEALARASRLRDLRLEVVGDGPLRGPLEDLAWRIGVADLVDFRGWLPRSAIPARMRAADVLVLPSLRECGGVAVLEAMATGLPVIAIDWGGPADYLDASCGILVEPRSREHLVEGFARAMAELAADPARRRALGRAGRARVERHYDWQVRIDRVLEIYRRAAGVDGRAQGLPAAGTCASEGAA